MTSDVKIIKTEPYTAEGGKRRLFFSRKQLCIPYGLFLAMFVVFPLMLIVYYAFTDRNGTITFANFITFFSETDNLNKLLLSIGLGIVTTAVCLLLSYPVAYILSRMKSHRRMILLLLFIMPMWINFVLRAMAMKELLNLLGLLGQYNFLNTVIGMVYDYMPFMVLPIYTTLIKIDKSYEEAAADLGASKAKVFLNVTLPLSVGGIISGATMVFLPSMTCFVISDTFGNGKITIIGKVIETWFKSGDDWNLGSAIALIMLAIMLITTIATGGFNKQEASRGTNL